MDILFDHLFPQVTRRCKACATGAHLHGEAIIEVSARLNHIRSGLGDEQLLGVFGKARCAAHNALGIADGIHLNNIIHIGLRNAIGRIGEAHDVVRDDHAFIRMERIELGITQRTAAGCVFFIAVIAVCIAIGVAGRCAKEGYVNVQLPGFNRRRTAAMGTEHDGEIHKPPGNLLRQFSAKAAGFNVGNHAVFDMLNQRGVDIRKGACSKGQILDAHFGDLLHNHIDNIVTIAEVMVEGNCHPIPKAGKPNCLFQGRHNLVL